MDRSKAIKFLRDVASALESEPEMPVPYSVSVTETPGCRLTYNNVGKAGLIALAKLASRATKSKGGGLYFLTGTLRCGIDFRSYQGEQSICERVQVGTRVVPEQVIPESVTPRSVVPAHEEPIYEWKCPELLAPEVEA